MCGGLWTGPVKIKSVQKLKYFGSVVRDDRKEGTEIRWCIEKRERENNVLRNREIKQRIVGWVPM